jgi:hypothetical protein
MTKSEKVEGIDLIQLLWILQNYRFFRATVSKTQFCNRFKAELMVVHLNQEMNLDS